MRLRGYKVLAAAVLAGMALTGCGSKAVKIADDRQITDEQLQRATQMQQQLLQQGLQTQQDNLRRLQETQGAPSAAPES